MLCYLSLVLRPLYIVESDRRCGLQGSISVREHGSVYLSDHVDAIRFVVSFTATVDRVLERTQTRVVCRCL